MPRTPGRPNPPVNRFRAKAGPLWPYLVLIAIPAAVFILPYLLNGQLLLTGDNLQQNYPLHVLVGDMLRHGQLPFWNPYIFSGTPLLADFNAGAFYPLMGFFVIFSPNVAWIATEVVLFAGIAIGMYVFLRAAYSLSTLASLLAAATFAFSGTVLSQINHVDMTEGFLAIPWMLLAVHHIVKDGKWRWSILLGVAFATVILAGAPEAMLDEALLVVAYAVMAAAGRDWSRWWRVLSRCAMGAALALSLAAIQWLPGLDAIRNSQRAGHVIASAGSYPTQFSILWLVPYLNGGYGNIGEARFFAQYNLPEVGVYLGILPLIALVTLLHPRWPSRISRRDRLTWYVVGLFGYLLALGSNTPLEHLFNSLPLYGTQRLQSRNMIAVATAACVLFAGWLDRSDAGESVSEARFRWYDRAIALLPVGIVAGLAVWALAAPASLVSAFAGVTLSPSIASTVREATIVALVLTAGAATLVWVRPRMTRVHWGRLVSAFVAVDLGIMALTSQLSSPAPNDLLSGSTSVQQLMAQNLSPGGRIVSYDPQTYASYPESPQGIPDLNVLANLPSVQGYASIVNGQYESATETHEQGSLNVRAVEAGTLETLNLQEIVTLPEYFLIPLSSTPRSIGTIHAITSNFVADAALPRGFGYTFDEQAYPFFPGPRPSLQAGQRVSWFFGETLSAASARLLLTAPAASPSLVRFGLVGSDGAIRWSAPVPVAAGAVAVSSPLAHSDGVGLTAQVLEGSLPAQRGAIDVAGESFELAGSLSSDVVPGPWRQVGMAQDYTVFSFTKPPVPIMAVTAGGKRVPLQVLSSTTKSEEVRVEAPGPTSIIRSVAWDSGWKGSLSVDGRSPVTVQVGSFNLAQQIRIPAGDDVVTFRYTPPHIVVATVLSAGSVLLLVLLGAVWVVRSRRRRGRGGGGGRGVADEETVGAEEGVLAQQYG
jgi:Bacterial membrane protein YfhO